MTANLSLHLTELEQRVAVLQLSIQGLRATHATDVAARADFDAVTHDVAKLRAHVAGLRIECDYEQGGR
jgi:hypothetical protein